MILKKCKLDVKSGGVLNVSDVNFSVKSENKDYVTLIKQGKFYYVYDTDALILNHIFDYKILSGLKCGFPDTSLEKVVSKLEELKISYCIKSYGNIIENKKFKNLNDYTRISILAKKTADLKNRLDILVKTIKISDKETLERVIESIEECLRL